MKTGKKIEQQISKNFGEISDCFDDVYKLGQAIVISFVLTCYLENKYKSKDIKKYMDEFMQDKKLKNMVCECMEHWL